MNQRHRHQETKQNMNPPASEQLAQNTHEEGIKINGLQQVVDLLRNADPAFRESLLKRLTQRDPNLAHHLRKTMR